MYQPYLQHYYSICLQEKWNYNTIQRQESETWNSDFWRPRYPKTTPDKKPTFTFRKHGKMDGNRITRAKMLFREYPNLENIYHLSDGLRKIYNHNISRSVAMLQLDYWFRILKNQVLNHSQRSKIPL